MACRTTRRACSWTVRHTLPVVLPLVEARIADAIHGRTARHKLDDTALRINRVFRSKLYSWFIAAVILLELGLGVLERPSMREDGTPGLLPFPYPSIIEVVCLLVFAADLGMRFVYLERAQFWKSRWTLARMYFIIFAFSNVLCVLIVGPSFPRLHRFARPVMLIAHFRNIAKIFGNILVSIPRVASVAALLIFIVIFTGVVFHTLFGGIDCTVSADQVWTCECASKPYSSRFCSPFSKNCFDYFGNLLSSMDQLFILITTANFPDVMLPAYRCYEWAPLLFAGYLILGLFFLLNLVLAVSYSIFQSHTKDKTLSIVNRRVSTLDRVFASLAHPAQSAEPPDPDPEDEEAWKILIDRYSVEAVEQSASAASGLLSGPSRAERARALLTKGTAGEISWSTWLYLMRKLRKDLTPVQIAILFRAMDTRNVGSLSKSDFRRIVQIAEVKFHSRVTGRQSEYLFSGSSPPAVIAFRQLVRRMVQHELFRTIFDLLIYINTCLVVIDFSIPLHSQGDAIISSIMWGLLLCFSFEIIAKIVGLGLWAFSKDRLNLIDVLIVVAALISKLVVTYESSGALIVQKIAFLRILRVLRAYRALPHFGLLIRTFATILPIFARYIVVMVTVYYIFAVLGMELFAGKIRPPEVDPTIVHRLNGTEYLESAYWDVTFDSMGRAYTTLFALMVVNNWAVTMEGYAAATNRWYMVFFYLWYFVIVIVVLNIVTAFLLDDYMVMQAQIQDEANGKPPEWRFLVQQAAEELGAKDWRDWLIQRPRHPQQVYELMFADEISQHIDTISELDKVIGPGVHLTEQEDSKWSLVRTHRPSGSGSVEMIATTSSEAKLPPFQSVEVLRPAAAGVERASPAGSESLNREASPSMVAGLARARRSLVRRSPSPQA
jgi:two pore calcium channel protein 1